MSLENMNDAERDDLAALADKLANDPSTRREFLKLTKKAHPSMGIPELDMEEHVAKATEASAKKIASLEDKLFAREVQDRVMSARNQIVKDGLVSESDVSEVEKLMVEKKIPDHRTAAEFFKLQKESARPTPSAFTPNTMPVDMKSMGNNPADWARREAANAIADIAKQRSH